jgi:spermidine/putrescine transport system ATP-binding protein
VLLLDEPLGALDLKLRKGMQLELKHLQTSLGITFVYVTHDQEEALTMSDRIVLMRQGRIAQVGTPRDLYDRPASRYVADFIGETNLLGGTVVESRNGEAALRIGVDVLRGISDGVLEAGREAWLAVRPEAIAVRPPEGLGGGNVVSATVKEAVYAGSAIRVHATLTSGQRIVAHVPAGTSVSIGSVVRLAWSTERSRFVPE